MNKAPAFQFYVKDWLSDINVLTMSAEERGVYIMLLCLDWNEGGLPDDHSVLAEVCKVDESTISTLVQRLFNGLTNPGQRSLNECSKDIETPPQKATNPRLQLERQNQTTRRQQQQKAGQSSSDKRQNKGKPKQIQRSLPSITNPGSRSLHSSPASATATVESKKESGVNPPRTLQNFVQPEIEEVSGYMAKQGLEPSTAQALAGRFVNFYGSKGWTVGKNPMKSWECSARNWVAGEVESASAKPNQAKPLNGKEWTVADCL